jgi:hypothetical protein
MQNPCPLDEQVYGNHASSKVQISKTTTAFSTREADAVRLSGLSLYGWRQIDALTVKNSACKVMQIDSLKRFFNWISQLDLNIPEAGWLLHSTFIYRL